MLSSRRSALIATLLPIVAVALFVAALSARSQLAALVATSVGIALAIVAIAAWIHQLVSDPWQTAARRRQRRG